MALDESDIDEAFIASAGADRRHRHALLAARTPAAAQTQGDAHRQARTARKVVFDIDYRPNLWGLAGHGAGEERYVNSDTVTAAPAADPADCDLIVGTEEELHIAGGSEDTLAALRAIRARHRGDHRAASAARWAASSSPARSPATLDDGIKGPGFPVEVYNVLGAGDAFMSGFLRGWLRGEPLETCCAYANACGAFAVSRLLCSPE